MRLEGIVYLIGISVLGILSCSSELFALEESYKTNAEFICGGKEIQITTKYKVYSPNAIPNCEDQAITFKNIKTGKTIVTTSSGQPYDEILDNTCADAYKCVKGKSQNYIVLLYRTGGNCEDCEWLGILDLKGNRVAIDRGKLNKTKFAKKWKSLGLTGHQVMDAKGFVGIPDE